MKLLNKIKRLAKVLWYGTFYGMKAADEVSFSQNAISDGGISLQQEVHSNRLSKALLKGEETQQTQELRYRTYLIDRESRKWKYITPTFAIKKKDRWETKKKNGHDSKFFKFENSDDLPIITAQDNHMYESDEIDNGIYLERNNSLNPSYEEIAKKMRFPCYLQLYKAPHDIHNGTIKVNNADEMEEKINEAFIENDKIFVSLYEDGKRKVKEKPFFTVKIKRNSIVRFKLEEFLKRIVVKRLDETHAILDFYFSKYPNDEFRTHDDINFRSKAFIHEVERIKDKKVLSDILSMESVSFVTSHAYHEEDLMEYEFNNVFFREVLDYDGNYILRFKSSIVKNGIDITKRYYSKTMDDKYKNNEKKEILINPFVNEPVVEYVCDECGRTVRYDTKAIDDMAVTLPRDITEDSTEEDDVISPTEYWDMQIVEQTIGKKLCKNCIKKYIDQRNEKR